MYLLRQYDDLNLLWLIKLCIACMVTSSALLSSRGTNHVCAADTSARQEKPYCRTINFRKYSKGPVVSVCPVWSIWFMVASVHTSLMAWKRASLAGTFLWNSSATTERANRAFATPSMYPSEILLCEWSEWCCRAKCPSTRISATLSWDGFTAYSLLKAFCEEKISSLVHRPSLSTLLFGFAIVRGSKKVMKDQDGLGSFITSEHKVDIWERVQTLYILEHLSLKMSFLAVKMSSFKHTVLIRNRADELVCYWPFLPNLTCTSHCLHDEWS